MPDRADFAARFDVSRETMAALDAYAALLGKWNPRINLVARSTLGALWSRHFADSAQVLDVAAPAPGARWADLGSGGGFPGLVVALLAQGRGLPLDVTLVEADRRKAVFLQTVARELAVPLTIRAERAEALPPLGADIVSARALAPLAALLPLVRRHLAPNGRAILPKGGNWRAELAEALESWTFQGDEYASITDGQAVILSLGEIARV